MEPRAILFDLDGVLVDSTAVVTRHWRAFAARHGLDAEAVIAAGHGRRTSETIAAVAPHLDIAGETARFDAAEEVDVDGLVAVRGAVELVGALAPDVWAVVTSGHRALATRRLQTVGLPAPSVMICGDEVTSGKPDPEGYLRAAAALGAAPGACVVIEDAPAGVAAGRSAGAVVVGVTTTLPASALAADAIVADLTELEVALAGLGLRAARR